MAFDGLEHTHTHGNNVLPMLGPAKEVGDGDGHKQRSTNNNNNTIQSIERNGIHLCEQQNDDDEDVWEEEKRRGRRGKEEVGNSGRHTLTHFCVLGARKARERDFPKVTHTHTHRRTEQSTPHTHARAPTRAFDGNFI